MNGMRADGNLKIASVIQVTLGQVLIRDFDFEGAVVTVVSVEVSPDLLQAKIGLGVLPREKELEVVTALNGSHRRLEHLLLKQMKIRGSPNLVFEIDS